MHAAVLRGKSKHTRFAPLLNSQSQFLVAGAMDSAPSQKWGLCGTFKNDGRREAFEEDLQRWISSGRRSDMLRGQGADHFGASDLQVC